MGIFIKIWIWLMAGIYKICSWMFKIFIVLSGKQLISNSSYQILSRNTYVIVGVVALFVLAFALLKGMINPDDSKSGTSAIKKMVINLVTSVAILAIVPFAFNFAYDVQDSIINYNTIGGFFGFGSLGEQGADEGNNAATVAANQIVNSVWTAFFNVNEEWCYEKDATTLEACQDEIKADRAYVDGVSVDSGTFRDVINSVDETGYFSMYQQFSEQVEDDEITFYAILTLFGGVFLLYISLTYTFGLAKRLVKLFFYQVIAPVPILLRVLPDGKLSGMFKQWMKVTFTCFFEVFVRIFILYFCIFVCVEIRNTSFLDNAKTKTNDVVLYNDSNINNNYNTLAYASDKWSLKNDEAIFAVEVPNIPAGGGSSTQTTDTTNNSETTTTTTSSSGGGWFLNLITHAFLYMGVLMFMKSAPKIISEVTGIDSSNIKLGLKDQLAESGLLTAGAAVGAWGTELGRGVVNKFMEKDEKGDFHWKKGMSTREKFKGAASIASRATRGFFGGIWSARNAKTGSDMRNAVRTTTSEIERKIETKEGYRARGQNPYVEQLKGTVRKMGEYFGLGVSNIELEAAKTAAAASDQANSMSEGTYKNKQEFMDQSSIVKRLAAENSESIRQLKDIEKAIANGTATQEQRNVRDRILEDAKYKEYVAQNNILKELRKDLSESKTNVLATAATTIAANQKANYDNNPELVSSFRSAVIEAFGGKDIDGKISGITGDNLKIVEAMLAGNKVNAELITRDNLIMVQDAIDKINVGRQNYKGNKEREYIVYNARNNPPASGDKK